MRMIMETFLTLPLFVSVSIRVSWNVGECYIASASSLSMVSPSHLMIPLRVKPAVATDHAMQ
jgi:hypothetical protein